MDKETAFFHYFPFGILTFETVCLYYFDFLKMLVKKTQQKTCPQAEFSPLNDP